MKKIVSAATLIIFTLSLHAQNFPGYRTGNYIGVNTVFYNPAGIADSRFRWDVNLFSANGYVGNNKGTFKLKDITSSQSGDFSDKFLSGNGNTNANVNVEVRGPSFMFNLNRKSAIAITTRARVVSNLKEFDGNLVSAVSNSDINTYPYSISSDANSRLINNAWSEAGVTYAREIKATGPHYFKAGMTLKYLSGAANNYLQIKKIKGTLNSDTLQGPFLQNTSGTLALGNAGVDVNNFSVNDLFSNGNSGIGADLGIVYEYRPDYQAGSADAKDRTKNKYKFKAGLALVDLGKIRYTSNPKNTAGYTIHINGANKFYLDRLNGRSNEEIKAILDSTPALFTPVTVGVNGKYGANLPTVVQGDFDYHLHRGFYINAGGQINVVSKNSVSGANQYNSFTVTPRYEGRAFGIYLPVNYSELTSFNAGISLRAGPLFVGSGSVITAIAKSKQADFHIGLHVGIQHKNKNKKQKEIKEEEPVQVVTDRDGDGIADISDKCPDVKGIASLKGCPDADGDGIADEEDKCPSVPGLAKYFGCPIPDTDADGINDEEDKCLTVKGVQKYFGCPIPDTDGDGVNDEEDKCPANAGPASNMGCPIIDKSVKEKINMAAQRIFFATGSAKLLPQSFKALDAVSDILKTDETLQLSIDGYTDNTGMPEKNRILSEQRAAAVKAYFSGKGIAESRLTSAGHGPESPVADNKTISGRAKNRRVELNVKNY